eukprot:4023100-Amphidinium_carterae.1
MRATACAVSGLHINALGAKESLLGGLGQNAGFNKRASAGKREELWQYGGACSHRVLLRSTNAIIAALSC